MRHDEGALRQEIVRLGRLMYEKGFISASDGNLSARLDDARLLITPSGRHKGLLTPDELLIVDLDGQIAGPRLGAARHLRPTSELPMHLEAYRLRPAIGAVVHAHPPISIALSIAGIPMTDCLLPEVIVFLGIVPTTAYATPSSEENVAAIRAFLPVHDAIVLQRHGTLTVGQTPMQAFMRLETVEQNARIGYMLAQLGVHNPLSPAEVEKLLAQRRAMGLAHPGEEVAFCEHCGVCHAGTAHAPTLRRLSPPARPSSPLPASPSAATALTPDLEAVRAIVARIVRQSVEGSG